MILWMHITMHLLINPIKMKRMIVMDEEKMSDRVMEWVMVYGWAILVVAVLIGSLVYFNVIGPTMFCSCDKECTVEKGQVGTVDENTTFIHCCKNATSDWLKCNRTEIEARITNNMFVEVSK
jgi:hypothetical protein